jgi:hypothetical protein
MIGTEEAGDGADPRGLEGAGEAASLGEADVGGVGEPAIVGEVDAPGANAEPAEPVEPDDADPVVAATIPSADSPE